jgi:hypothetical protein
MYRHHIKDVKVLVDLAKDQGCYVDVQAPEDSNASNVARRVTQGQIATLLPETRFLRNVGTVLSEDITQTCALMRRKKPYVRYQERTRMKTFSVARHAPAAALDSI